MTRDDIQKAFEWHRDAEAAGEPDIEEMGRMLLDLHEAMDECTQNEFYDEAKKILGRN